MSIWKSVAGQVRIEMTCADVPSVITKITSERIPLFSAKQIDKLTVQATIYRKDYRKLKFMIQKEGGKIFILNRIGIYWYFLSFLHRPILAVGILLLLALSIYIPTHVFFITVEGNSTVPDRLILEKAAECGIHFGVSRRTIRSERMKNSLLSAIPELEWSGINTSGCVATLTVKEAGKQESNSEPDYCAGIAAGEDGVVRSITVLQGNSLCTVGSAVRKGELLISGYTDLGNCVRQESARGEVIADTNRRISAVIPLDFFMRTEKIKSEKKKYVLIGKKRINFFKDSGILDDNCVRMRYVKKLTLPGGFELPAALVTEQTDWYTVSPGKIEPAAAKMLLKNYSDVYLKKNMIAGKILGSTGKTHIDRNCMYYFGTYACREMIGRRLNWEIMEQYGKNFRTDCKR